MERAVSDTKRVLVTLTGVVQGVGFRPFIFRIACGLGLRGWVENQGSRVLVDVEGSEESVDAFVATLREQPPENAHIADLQLHPQPPVGYADFSIKRSTAEENTAAFIPPDIAVCRDCLKEFHTPGHRRFQYPFISCAQCGPRYSIMGSLPYDRENTAMSQFFMCPQCAAEYHNPNDRRFHAQTNCCPACGPVLQLLDAKGNPVETSDPMNRARELISKGEILAVKGIGGYHLCCNAEDPAAVKTLRGRKGRAHKPLAIMARNLEGVLKVCQVSEREAGILSGSRKPILLLPKREPEILPEEIAPHQRRLGVMLPYAPLQLLLFPEGIEFLVMTSGNFSGTPICYNDDAVVQSLGGVAAYVLTHNREIRIPVDDAVVKVMDDQEMLVRCGRGYAPLTLPLESHQHLLAVGGQQKSSVCMVKSGFATMSQYIGELDEYQAYLAFERQIEGFAGLFQSRPSLLAHDLNPDYLSTRYAKEKAGESMVVQHHHGHMAGCMAENKLNGPVIGVIFDGTGLGTDGAVWGGEFLTGTLSQFTRAGHLQYVTLQGGDGVVREPWRCAASYLYAIQADAPAWLPQVPLKSLDTVHAAIRDQVHCFQSSSMGRLFDCVAALCGFQTAITYEAQAAIELEGLADPEVLGWYSYRIRDAEEGLILEYENLLRGILRDLQNQVPVSTISAKFHQTIVEATADCVSAIHDKTGLKDVVLSGGVFENVYLLRGLIFKLKERNFRVYYNRLIPTNDSGLSFGQAAAAGAMGKEAAYVSGDTG